MVNMTLPHSTIIHENNIRLRSRSFNYYTTVPLIKAYISSLYRLANTKITSFSMRIMSCLLCCLFAGHLGSQVRSDQTQPGPQTSTQEQLRRRSICRRMSSIPVHKQEILNPMGQINGLPFANTKCFIQTALQPLEYVSHHFYVRTGQTPWK